MQLIQCTPSATKAILDLIHSTADASVIGIRVTLQTKGCSGMSWNLELARNKVAGDDEVKINDEYSIFIDKKATLFILGTQLDYVETDLQSGFIFHNPKEKGRCGCGQSFYV